MSRAAALPQADVPSPPVSTAWCSRCSKMLPTTSFHWSKGQRQAWCKACRADYLRERGDLHIHQTRAARARRRQLATEYVLDVIRCGSCADGGLGDSIVLEFDHLRQKRADVAKLVHEGYALKRVQAEVAKCELVCVNCHRRRTAARAPTGRVAVERVEAIDRPLRRRNLLFVIDYLQLMSCVDCGEHDIVLLDFDHVGAKRGSVVELAWDEHSLASLGREIDECDVRCANCHRRRTVLSDPSHMRHQLLD